MGEERGAMADLNKVFLMGRLTFDPELRRTTGGMAVTELRMATSRSWTGKDGERREEKLFIDVTVWDRQAENCCQYLRKGSGIHVEGSLKLDSWDDKNSGEKRSKIRVTAERVQFLDSRRGESGGGMSDGSDDEFAGTREPAARRGGPAGRGQGAPAESMGSSNGPGRPPAYPSAGASDNAPARGLDDAEEDDIPF
jgi:single-strand DNA-binding protein